MNKQEFIDGYCERSGISWDELSGSQVALPCSCGDELCDGWAMITNTPSHIKDHNDRNQQLTSLNG